MTDKVIDKREWNFTMVENPILRSRQLSTYEKLTYVILCSFANVNTGECYPSVNTVSELVGCSENTARKTLRSLENHKLISIQQRRDGEVNKSNLYLILNLPEWIKIEYEESKQGKFLKINVDKVVDKSTSPNEVLQEMKGGTSPHEGGVLHQVKGGTSPGEPELYSINYTQLELDKEKETKTSNFKSDVHEKIFKSGVVTEISYKTWFENTEIESTEDLITIKASSQIFMDGLKKYSKQLEVILNKKINITVEG